MLFLCDISWQKITYILQHVLSNSKKMENNGFDMICDRIHRIKAKKGQKKTMEPCQELTWDFRFLTKLLTSFTQKKAPLSFVWKPHVPIRLDTKIPTLILLFLLLSISSTYLHCLSNDKYKILPYLHAVALLCKWSGNFSQKLLESGNSA